MLKAVVFRVVMLWHRVPRPSLAPYVAGTGPRGAAIA
jgi:hypothetical protein